MQDLILIAQGAFVYGVVSASVGIATWAVLDKVFEIGRAVGCG